MQPLHYNSSAPPRGPWRSVLRDAEARESLKFAPPLPEVPDNRRRHERVAVAVPLQIQHVEGPSVVTTHDLSESGACIDADERLGIGDVVDVALALPTGEEPVQVKAEVRWARKGKAGLVFRSGALAAVAAFVGSMLAAPTASAAAKTSIPQFDPNADVTIDMKAGGERPDEIRVMEAFERQYTSFDQCVAHAKRGRDKTLPGDVDVEVLLNPKGAEPLGVNAKLPDSVDKSSLRECLRSAVAAADYPSYDGPPVVVAFNFELDPGTYYEEE